MYYLLIVHVIIIFSHIFRRHIWQEVSNKDLVVVVVVVFYTISCFASKPTWY